MSAPEAEAPPKQATIVPVPAPVTPPAAGVAQRNGEAVRRARGDLRAMRRLLATLFVLALLYTVTLARALLIPLVLAAFIGLALNPLVAFARRHGMPRWLSACVLMLALIGGIGSGIGLLAQPALGWFHTAPTAIKNFVPKLKALTQPIEAANRATQTLVTGQIVRVQPPRPAALAITAWDVIAKAPQVLAAVLTVVLLVFFFLVFGDTLLRRLVQLTPGFGYRRHAVAIVRGIQTEVSRYILTTVVINASLGLLTAGMLWLYKVPDPLLWGTVAMLANFIPYVGSITTTTLLALVGLINFDNVGHALLPALTFAGITIIEGNFFTPMIQGRRMRLSPIAILLWLLVWGWLWGIPGALLAVPMLTSFKLIAERVRGWSWFARMVQR
jgi:predicted PurR-regulated permease PerM